MPTEGLTVNQALQQAVDHQNHGRLAEAEKLYRTILTRLPDQPEVLHLLALLCHQSNRQQEAETLIRKALSLTPSETKFRATLGAVLQAQGRPQEAVTLYRETLAASPPTAEILNHLGVAQSALGHFDQAAQSFTQALQLTPDDPAINGNLGIALCHLHRHAEAIPLLNAALSRQPNVPDFHAALATALLHQNQLDAALAACRRALALDPAAAQAHQTLSQILTAQGHFPEAAAAAQRAAELLPENPDLQLTLASALEKLDQLDAPAAIYRQALARHPHSAPLHNNLANVLKNQGQLDDALAHYRLAIAAEPHNPQHFSNYLFAAQFHPHLTPAALFNEHRRFNDLHALPLAPQNPRFPNTPSPHRRLRIGYIGMQFRSGYHLYPLFAHHDRSQFEIFCYSNTPYPDAHTENFRRHTDRWHDIRPLTDSQVAGLVRSDQIDILIDLSLHMGHNRLLVFARKPAPVQISYFGYPATTGLTAIDYRLTDRHLEPVVSGQVSVARNESPPPSDHWSLTTDHYSSETPLHLPDTFWCYHPQIDLPVNSLPMLTTHHITFGNLNNFCKLNEPTLDLWSQILRNIPRSRLLMMTPEGSHRDRTRHFLAQRTITPDRIDFIPYLPPEKYFQTYHHIDLGLDSFPYNGHTTSLDAFYMGVPVLTLIGQTPVSRAGYSQLLNLHLPDLAAPTPAAFIHLATTLAQDPARLAALRQSLRPTMAASPLVNAPRYAQSIESAYRLAWQNWCAKQNP